jgi:hypothetical protein
MVSTTLRTSRTTRGTSGIEIATTTVTRLAPASAIMAIANKMPGIAISPSITRITTASTRRT